MLARCGGCTSPPAPCATARRRRPRIRRCSRAGTGPRSRAACSSPPRRPRPASPPAHTPMPISTSPSHNWTRHWARRGLVSPVPACSAGRVLRSLRVIAWNGVSLLAAAGSACARPQPVTPGTEPELRIGLAAGAPGVTLGGDGELFVSDDSNGEPLGSIPVGTTWTVLVDTPGVRLVKPDGSRVERRLGGPGVRRLGRRARSGVHGRGGRNGRGVGRPARHARGGRLVRGRVDRGLLPFYVRIADRGRGGSVPHGARPTLPALGLGRVRRRPRLLRHLAAVSLARGMGRRHPARYIVADAAGGDERGRRRPAAHHRRGRTGT